ncbi:MAG: hypothetical protein JWN13_5405 [Betaproteobacteria bacterium]|nr:hypothetical protein [Betaproteobacteria bacterium]
MSADRYIEHITLTTGHTRRSWRHEIDPALMPRIAELVESAREETGALIQMEPECWLRIEDTRKCALITVSAHGQLPLMTMAVATHARCGAQLWRLLHDTAQLKFPERERPALPWCAVRLETGLALYPGAAHWLGDMERCVAWAWLDGRLTREPQP